MGTDKRTQARHATRVPELISFEQWNRNFDKLLTTATARTALNAFMLETAITPEWEHSQVLVDEAEKRRRLELIYGMTQPIYVSPARQQSQEYAIRQVKELDKLMRTAGAGVHEQIRRTITALEPLKDGLIPKDGRIAFNPERYLRQLREALQADRLPRELIRQTQTALAFIAPGYAQGPKWYTHCIPFAEQLLSVGVGRQPAIELCAMIMRAHGFTDEEVSLHPKDIEAFVREDKTLRDARKAYEKRLRSLITSAKGQ